MKYKKLRLSLNYEKYSETGTNTLNSYIKNKVYFSMGEFYIYVDFDNVDYGKNKLGKAADKKLTETLSKLNETI